MLYGAGTFNLIWNDLKNDLAKQDIVFENQEEFVNNLNKGTFNTSYLSENSYYKKYGTPTPKLKEEIEKAIKEKFNEDSDILGDFEFEGNDPKDYFLYVMLKKEFEFPKEFTDLGTGEFGKNKNVKYFGINSDTSREVREQVEVLYYTSKEDFAIKLLTKNNEEVIISRGNIEENFKDIYEGIMKKSENRDTSSTFKENDILKIPNISFDIKEEIKKVEKRPFLFSNGDPYIIDMALQTIKFDLDRKGGRIKSEAGMMVKYESAVELDNPRKFVVDNTFTIFLKEVDEDLPYFAAKVTDANNIQ